MTLSDEEIGRLFQVRKTLMQMLRDRGYLVEDFEINMSREEFISKFGKKMRRRDLFIHKSKSDDSSDQIYVFFLQEAKVGMRTIKTRIERMKSENVFRAILVIQLDLTRFAQVSISEVKPKFVLEVFQEVELLDNITYHFLVPKHQVLTTEEKNTLLERYTVKETQLPRIKSSDPVARYYGLTRSQVVKITRPSETAGQYITYRIVV